MKPVETILEGQGGGQRIKMEGVNLGYIVNTFVNVTIC
jgi:hypothetical protein